MSDRFNLQNAQFKGPVQIGDYNVQAFTQNLDARAQVGALDAEVVALLRDIHRKVVESPKLNDEEKRRFTSDLATVSDELVKPEDQRDESRLKRYWRTVVATAEEAAPLLGALAALGKLIGLPV